jgi:hypothetical protein
MTQRENPNTNNRLVAGSIPAEPRTCDVSTEELSVRDMLQMLLGPDGKRKLRLRHKTNSELFALYTDEPKLGS